MKRKISLLLAALLCLALLCAPAFADDPTDEILNYEITASVNDDGTVNLDYHLDWKVLRDDIGALEWVTVGIPNGEYISMDAGSDTVRSIGYSGSSGSSVRIDFDREYHAGETVSFDFTVVQDYMYQMNLFEDGKTAYVFTPGWFDEIAVDNLTVRWDVSDVDSWSPNCLIKDGYLEWNQSLEPGETVQVTVNYPNDARDFSDSKAIFEPGDRYNGGGENYGGSDGEDDAGAVIGGLFVLLLFVGGPIWAIRKIKNAYRRSASFGSATKQKITRTKVTYYPVCQGCGAPRGEGETTCSHCGRSFIKSEETIKEENVPDADREALKYKTKGEYRYSSSPDTYVRVNVVNVPVVHHVSSSSSSRSSSSRGGGSSCAHSSCACACASCACACACACAGGGRAGCTFKDFYRTDLKLRQLLQRKGRRN